MSGMGKLGLGLGLTAAAGVGTPTGISLSRTTVDEDLAVGTGVGLLSVAWQGKAGTGTFSITSDPDNKFAISGDELVIDNALSWSTATASHAVTVQFTPTSGDPISQAFTINVNEVDTVTEPDLAPSAGSMIVDSGFTVTPQVSKSGGDLRIQGKSGGVAKFVFDIGAPVAGTTYTAKYDADWSLLSNQGREVFVGFGFLDDSTGAEDFHFPGVKGDGGSGLNKYRITGDGSFRGTSGFTQTNGGAASHGTQSGPNWIQLAIAEDGLDYILRTSSDGVTWTDEFTDIVPTPFADAETSPSFGIAVFMPNSDKGSFEINIQAWTATGVGYPDPVWIGRAFNGTNGTSFSFPSFDISSAAEDASRKLIIGVGHETGTAYRPATDVTIDISGGASGVVARRITAVNTISLWAVDCPAGSTIDINVTQSATRGYTDVAVWAIYTDADPAEAYSVSHQISTASPSSLTINKHQLGGGNTFTILGANCIDASPLWTAAYTGANSLTINERVNVNNETSTNQYWGDAMASTDEEGASFLLEQSGGASTCYAMAVTFTIGPVAIDPFAANVVFLADFEGANGATSYTEESANAYAATFYGNAQISNSQGSGSDGGATSLDVGSTAGDKLIFDTAPVPFLDFTEPWTIEIAYYLAAGTNQYYISQWDAGGNERAWAVWFGSTERLSFYYSTNGSNFTNVAAPIGTSTGQWYYGVINFDGTQVRVRSNNYSGGKHTPSGAMHTPASGTKLHVGNRQDDNFPTLGNIDHIRITKGKCRYSNDDAMFPPEYYPAVV